MMSNSCHIVANLPSSSPAALSASAIAAGGTGRRFGRRIEVYDCVTSTNDLGLRLLAGRTPLESAVVPISLFGGSDQALDGRILLAESQTQGRGRLGRTWTMPRGGGLLMSVLIDSPVGVHSRSPAQRAGIWTAWAAVSVAECLAEWVDRSHVVSIKWPNDVRIDRLKVAGILVERPAIDTGGFVVGIGINLQLDRDSFLAEVRSQAGSLNWFVAPESLPLDRNRFAGRLIEIMNDYGFDLETREETPGRFARLVERFQSRLEGFDAPVILTTPRERLQGRLVGLEPGGLARLETAAGPILTRPTAWIERITPEGHDQDQMDV